MTVRTITFISLTAVALLTITLLVLGLYFTERLRGDATRVNLTGQERYRTYRLAFLLEELDEQGEDKAAIREEIDSETAKFEAILNGLIDGDPKLGLRRTTAPDELDLLKRNLAEWGHIKSVMAMVMGSEPGVRARIKHDEFDHTLVPAFVASIDETVRLIEENSSGKVLKYRSSMAALSLLSLILLGSVFALISYRVLRPLSAVAEGLDHIRRGDLELRLDASGSDELGSLASGYNMMAKSLSDEIRARKEMAARVLDLEESNSDFRDVVMVVLENLDQSEAELKRAYRSLKETQAQLVQSCKLTALGEFTAGLAHEISQPLTVIRGLSQHLIKESASDETGLKKLRLIESSTRKMEQIINHLRVFSRVDEGELSPVNLNEVIEDALIFTRELLKKDSVEIYLRLGQGCKVMGCAGRLEQVVINLITNARDAMAGGGRLCIDTQVVGEGKKKFVMVSFRDSGHGVPPDIRGRLFEPFFTTKGPGKGTGLGLSISYGIIKEHGGEISLCSGEAGCGAEFRIMLPAR